ncbi:zinc ribbon domain-containing protein [Candidatus Contubernalis alkaliaceticus]|uniref:zinc ribbon domain-containing protein n=1 Tax=Candidatus Contubernalis alkaliaceticus TaxID=338645 RepID=UPI001F4C2C9C|nr:zinc ribbon domain-containing protein [Candidatus Contubernalis alkalaceticus]UNC91107.1 zinc ribbon domain-containing protein [Candidatus Contubernalis alkalaceticus]
MFCNNCGQENNVENLYCLLCGVLVYKKTVNIRSAIEGRSFCGACGFKLITGSLYCPGCGEDLSKLTLESAKPDPSSIKLNINRGKTVQRQGLAPLRWEIQDLSFLLRSFFGAVGALAFGLILAWFVGLAFEQFVANILREFYITSSFFKVNPLALFFQAHGAPLHVQGGIYAFGSEASASLTIRIGLIMLMFIPFLALFFSAYINSGHLNKNDLSGRIRLALGQGLLYGITLAILSKLLGRLIHLPMDQVADLFGLMEVVRYTEASGMVTSGFPFFHTLFLGVFWGCLFSTAGAVYSSVKFNFARIAGYYDSVFSSGIGAAFQMFKYLIMLSGLVILGAIISLEINESVFEFVGAVPGLIFSILLFVNGISFVMLLLNGAVFQMGYIMPGESDAISASLFTGVQTPYDTYWYWYLFLLLLVPIILGFAGGFQSQKYSPEKSAPWKNALSFSISYTLLFVAVALVSQVTGHLDLSRAASLLGMMGEQVPGKALYIFGFPMIKSLLTIGIISFLTGLTGTYYASYQESN